MKNQVGEWYYFSTRTGELEGRLENGARGWKPGWFGTKGEARKSKLDKNSLVSLIACLLLILNASFNAILFNQIRFCFVLDRVYIPSHVKKWTCSVLTVTGSIREWSGRKISSSLPLFFSCLWTVCCFAVPKKWIDSFGLGCSLERQFSHQVRSFNACFGVTDAMKMLYDLRKV